GSTMMTASVALASSTRQKAMIFSVREKASSGAARPRWATEKERDTENILEESFPAGTATDVPFCLSFVCIQAGNSARQSLATAHEAEIQQAPVPERVHGRAAR